ncbi:MAG: metallophosphoesterase [Bacteroidetes bacterium]|nr:metallophosphoesterase [Bacteroidota bacterium]
MQKNIAFILGLFFLLEFYIYQAYKTVVQNTALRWLYIGVTLFLYFFLAYKIFSVHRSEKDHHSIQIIATLFLGFVLPKLLVGVFLLSDDVMRLSIWFSQSLKGKTTHYPERRKFLSMAGLAVGGALSVLVLDGVWFGKYRHHVRKIRLRLNHLPAAFRGYRIVQISDVHSGSFFHPEKLKKAIDLINEQHADLVVFTGDMVNDRAEEFQPFINLFSGIKAKDGKISILGNHDYGDYVEWESKEAKNENLLRLIDYQKQAGFRMLRNEHFTITKEDEKLYIIGVENWGDKPFPQLGDLDKACAEVPKESCKILLSHDPTHFDRVVKKHSKNIQLTLSGHTHGMQFGLDLKNIKWSPVQYKYPKWADLYESEGKYLYVNRGFGVIGYPGRVGVDPEITVFELV